MSQAVERGADLKYFMLSWTGLLKRFADQLQPENECNYLRPAASNANQKSQEVSQFEIKFSHPSSTRLKFNLLIQVSYFTCDSNIENGSVSEISEIYRGTIYRRSLIKLSRLSHRDKLFTCYSLLFSFVFI